MSVELFRGGLAGHSLCISTKVFSEEITGDQIIHPLICASELNYLRSSLDRIPVVTVYGFVRQPL